MKLKETIINYDINLSTFLNNHSRSNFIHSGSYGIGVSRLVAAIIESSYDDKGIIWPKEVAPFIFNIICLNVDNKDCKDISSKIYKFCK